MAPSWPCGRSAALSLLVVATISTSASRADGRACSAHGMPCDLLCLEWTEIMLSRCLGLVQAPGWESVCVMGDCAKQRVVSARSSPRAPARLPDDELSNKQALADLRSTVSQGTATPTPTPTATPQTRPRAARVRAHHQGHHALKQKTVKQGPTPATAASNMIRMQLTSPTFRLVRSPRRGWHAGESGRRKILMRSGLMGWI